MKEIAKSKILRKILTLTMLLFCLGWLVYEKPNVVRAAGGCDYCFDDDAACRIACGPGNSSCLSGCTAQRNFCLRHCEEDDGGGGETYECTIDAHCPAGYRCESHRCYLGSRQCYDSSHCGTGQTCFYGQCY